MSIYGALFSAVSGLFAQSQALGTISDNISNVNTTGYKDTSEQFSTLVTEAASATSYTPGGVLAHPRQLIDRQGLLQSAASPTDVAVSGQGFFVVNTNASSQSGTPFYFTRAGDFQPDAQGNLVNTAGYFLQGFATDANGNVITSNRTTTTDLETINVNGLSGTAAATQNITIAANLPATDAAGTKHDVTAQIYDSIGVAHNLTLEFTKTATLNQWTLDDTSLTLASSGVASGTVTYGPATVTFNSDGTLNTVSATSLAITGFTTGAANDTITLDLGTSGKSDGLSQFSNTFNLASISQDGRAFGNLTGVSIDKTGLVVATFSNGQTRPFAKIPVATFPGTDYLQGISGNAYQATAQSGNFLLQDAGTANAGTVQSGALEQSTVDLAAEFSNMIITQRAYSASARVITTADQMLQVLDQIGR